jgi:hypothetical protein
MIYLYTDQYSEILAITREASTDESDRLITCMDVKDLNDLMILIDMIDGPTSQFYMEPVFDLKDLIKLLQAEIE